MNQYLEPTAIIDSDHPRIIQFAKACTAEAGGDPRRAAVALFLAVRDRITYDPYTPFFLPVHYRASRTLRQGRGFCIPKSALLCALARAAGIPARMGFATVRNHLATRQLVDYLGSDRFVYHGFAELFLDQRWIKATPVFDADLCDRFKVPPLDFDGIHDAVFQAFNDEDAPFIEYLADHGTYTDVPVDDIVSAWQATYGAKRVDDWIDAFNASAAARDFRSEDVA